MPTNIVKGFNVNGSTVQYDYESLSDRILKSSIASEYSDQNSYSVGDYVLYSGQLYKCDIEIIEPEEFNQNKWEIASIGNELFSHVILSDEVKQALLNCFEHVAWTNANGQQYYNELEEALYAVTYITAVYTQTETVYETENIDNLKENLVVTAYYSDGRFITVNPNYYELFGELQSGISTITVSYGGKTTTFEVNVVGIQSISAVFTQGNATVFDDQDLDDLKKYLVVTVNYSNGDSAVVDDYVLSGTLSDALSEITVYVGEISDSFNVVVTSTALPSGYTRYGYIQKKTDSAGTKASSTFIFLNAQQDMNVLSIDVLLQAKGSSSNVAGAGIMGARLSTSDGGAYSIPYIAMYFGGAEETGRRIDCPARGAYVDGVYCDIFQKHRVRLINKEQSPYYIQVDDGEPLAIAWGESHPVVPYGLSLFNNIQHGSTSNFSINHSARIGRIILRKYDDECVGYYAPCVYSGKIGMYDFISQTFYTAATASAVTISNSGCLYAVGNWS